jgi:aminoglycoside phosphotransferase (APT) family kinase protein
MAEISGRLTSWFARQLPDARDVTVEGVDRVAIGHSSETVLVTVVHDGHRQDVVIRVRPPAPGLLEPYDLQRQFAILRVMERLPGQVYERGGPDDLAADPGRIRRMCEGIVEQIAAIHAVNLHATGLDAIADGRDYLDRELGHWAAEIERVKRGRLPALERLVDALRERQPEQSPPVTLVHGDPKPGNFAFVGGDVTAVFDWEMTTVGDPLADIGWAEILWMTPGSFTSRPGALSTDELVARWEELTGITAQHRPWYRAFQAMKMAVIMLVGGHLVDAGHSNDVRLAEMAYVVHPMTKLALHELGIDQPPDAGPVLPRKERQEAVKQGVRA